jgi:hypothetical protein
LTKFLFLTNYFLNRNFFEQKMFWNKIIFWTKKDFDRIFVSEQTKNLSNFFLLLKFGQIQILLKFGFCSLSKKMCDSCGSNSGLTGDVPKLQPLGQCLDVRQK